MKILNTILSVVIAGSSMSQISLQPLDQNNVSAMITDAGFFFNKPGVNLPGYEVPAGSGLNTIYSGAFWFGGLDLSGQLKLAAPDIFGMTSDMWPGPLTETTANPVSPNPLGQTLWAVTQSEIDNHITNFNQPGYITPTSILNWPAHGDVSLGLSYFLAPFVDVNYDGVYDPSTGDHPCIKGDRAVYTIMNDKEDLHGSGGDPIGLEVHYMFYQFEANDYLDNTTFIDVNIYNRGTQGLFDFTTSFIMDGDLGGSTDDYVGCDSTRNLMYIYNADNYDEAVTGSQGYGVNPPAAGVVCLSHDMTSMVSFSNGASFPQGAPSNELESYHAMLGYYSDQSPILDDNNQSTKFQYSGNPNNSGEWSEYSVSNIPGDRRSVMSSQQYLLNYQDRIFMTYAVLYDRSGTNNLENVNGLLSTADLVQAFYDANLDDVCDPSVMSVDEINEIEFSLYPNPSTGAFSIDTELDVPFNLSVMDMSGRRIYSESNASSNTIVNLNAPAGVYFVNVSSDGISSTMKLIVE